MNKTPKKTTKAKPATAGTEEPNRFETNLSLLRKRRRRVKSNIEKLDALIDGTTTEVDMDDLVEARKLLGLYNGRLLKAVKKNKKHIEGA